MLCLNCARKAESPSFQVLVLDCILFLIFIILLLAVVDEFFYLYNAFQSLKKCNFAVLKSMKCFAFSVEILFFPQAKETRLEEISMSIIIFV